MSDLALDRFARLIGEVSDECWEWTGAKTALGYGMFRDGGRVHGAHRRGYQLLVDPDLPANLVLDHLCRNPSCVNPDHLEPVTERENILRGEGACATNARKTHCIRGHEFTEENTYTIPRPGGGRSCRTCKRDQNREAQRRYMARKRNQNVG